MSRVPDENKSLGLLQVLGVPEEAGPEELRQAYLRKVKEFPPDQAPEEFERVRDAYLALSNPRVRSARLLYAEDALAPFVELLAAAEQTRRFVGAGPWRAVLRERRSE